MQPLKFVVWVASFIALSACTTVPKSISLDAASGESIVVLEAAAPQNGRNLPEFSLNIAKYSESENRLEANSLGGWAKVNSAARSADGRYWLVGSLKPGKYVISALTHQDRWMACFNSGTRAFDVGPGSVVFLGRIDPLPPLVTIASTLPRSTTSHEFALDQRIPFASADEIPEWRPQLEAYLRAEFPNVTAPLTVGASQDATFNTGWDLTRTSRVCGGYYAPAGKKEPAADKSS